MWKETTTTVLCAASLAAGTTTPATASEFEAVLLTGAPFAVAGEGSNNPRAVADLNDQGVSVYIDEIGRFVYVDAAGAEPVLTILADIDFGSGGAVRINRSGQVARTYYNVSALSTTALWTPTGGDTVIEETFLVPGGQGLLLGGGIADDGTVFYADADSTYWKWSSDLGSPVTIGAVGGASCELGDFVAASPGGRAATTYGVGFFCSTGVGVVDWIDPNAAPRLSPLQPSGTPSGRIVGINDAGLVCAHSASDGVVYDVENGGAVVDTFSFADGGFPLGIDENGWIMSSGGTLYRDGAYESLVDLLTGVDAVEYVHAQAEGGHFLARVTVDGESTMALIRPASASVPGDLNGDGVVAFDDLLLFLSAWGPCPGCPADLDGDGTVGFADLLALLSSWD